MTELKRHYLPQTPEEWRQLDAPIARERIEGDECRLVGKIFSWSPLYFDVAFIADNQVVRRKVLKKTVHLDPCPHCPDYQGEEDACDA